MSYPKSASAKSMGCEPPAAAHCRRSSSAPRLTTSISATSKSLPISWAGLPTRPPPRMSIAISYGWPRSGRPWEPPMSAPLHCGSCTLKRHDLAEELISTREPRRLPVVLSPEEVGRLLAAATNTKHRAILSLAYATGLRASEVVSLKLTDIDRNRMLIRVEQGKGKKDRYVILSPILLEILHEWWRVARKKGWMSPGQP